MARILKNNNPTNESAQALTVNMNKSRAIHKANSTMLIIFNPKVE